MNDACVFEYHVYTMYILLRTAFNFYKFIVDAIIESYLFISTGASTIIMQTIIVVYKSSKKHIFTYIDYMYYTY